MKVLKHIIKIVALTVVSVLLLAVVLVILFLSGVFNQQLTLVVNKHAGKFINGQAYVESIEGMPVRSMTFRNLQIRNENDTIIFAESIRVNYKLKSLLHKTIKINDLSLNGVQIKLIQDTDSIWNLMKLIPLSEETPKPETPEKSFDWVVELENIAVSNLQVSIASLDIASYIPAYLETDFGLSFRIDSDKYSAKIKNFGLKTYSPSLVVEQLKTDIEYQGNRITIQNFELEMPLTRMFADVNLDLTRPEALTMNLDVPILNFNDFRDFLNEIPLYGEPSLSVTASENQYRALIKLKNQQVSLDAWISGLENDAGFKLNAELNDVDIAQWTNDKEMRSQITGNILAEGKGLDFMTNQISISSGFKRFKFLDYEAGIHFQARKNGQTIAGNIGVNSRYGKINSWFRATEVFDVPAYAFNLTGSHIDVSHFTGDSILASDIGFTLKVQGRGYQPESMQAYVDFESTDNLLAGIPIEHIGLKAGYRRGNYQIDEAVLKTAFAGLNLTGHGNLKGPHTLEYSIRLDSLNALAHLAGADTLNLNAEVTGKISGMLNDLNIIQHAKIGELLYETYRIGKLDVFTDLNLTENKPVGTNLIKLRQANLYGIDIDSLRVETKFDGLQADNQLHSKIDEDIDIDLDFGVSVSELPMLVVSNLGFRYRKIQWSGKTDTVVINPKAMSIRFPSILLQSGNQGIAASGYFSMDSVDISLNVHDLEIGNLPLETFSDIKLSGLVNSEMVLYGNSINPILHSRIKVNKLTVDTLSFDTVYFAADYAGNLLSVEGSADIFGNRLLNIVGKIPFHLSLTDSITPLWDDERFTFQASGHLNNLDPFATFIPDYVEADGRLNLILSAEKSLKTPDFQGLFRIENGRFRYPDYGVNFQNLKMASHIDQTRFIIDSLWMQSGRGWLNISGFAQLAGLDSLFVDDFSFRVRADRFTATNGPQAELVVNSDATVQGNQELVRFGGKMEVERGLIHIDAILSQYGMVADDPNPPLLLKALQQMEDSLQVDEIPIHFDKPTEGFDFMKKLTGEFDIEIPGNLWVRGKDMNFELAGNLKAIQESGELDLFGLIEVRRGHYTLYGKRLNIEKGEIELTGGSDMNPLLDFSIGYSFRDSDKQLRKLAVNISGRALNPEITFNLDDQRIEEKDGIAYLMFGKSLAELTQGEQSSVNLNAAEIGRGLALGQLSGLLQGALQTSLGLDLFDIEGDDNWGTGSVTIGKYLTRNLFMSYSREFSLDKKSKVTYPDQLSLEYQIFRWLYLQAISQGNKTGFDLIFQKKWR